jgi:hypothetical protein
MTTGSIRAIGYAIAVAVLVSACGGPPKEPPPPLRPKELRTEKVERSQRTDCDPIDPYDGLPAMKFDERSIEEAENLANQGFNLLKQSQARGLEREETERMIDQSVSRFITALLADPYNVHATYHLAAAYARIGRAQCAVNLIGRLLPLRGLRSQKARVEEKLDRLLGRDDFKGRLDPDFFDLRDDKRFRALIKRFEPGAEENRPKD